MDSLTICHSTSSGSSMPANGRTTRKHTSVNGSPRKTSSSSGECRAISAGMYSPPSGASPRSTAPRSDVSGALPEVLRYLIKLCVSSYLKIQRRKLSRMPLTGNLTPNLCHKFLDVVRRGAQFRHRQRDVRQHFITLPPRGQQRWIASRHRVLRQFARLRAERAAPQYRL